MKLESWHRQPSITPNYGSSRQFRASGVRRSSKEMAVIFRTNPYHERQLTAKLSNLNVEYERNMRLLKIDRQMFVARQVSKQRRLDCGGIHRAVLIPPYLVTNSTSSQDEETQPGASQNDQQSTDRRTTADDDDTDFWRRIDDDRVSLPRLFSDGDDSVFRRSPTPVPSRPAGVPHRRLALPSLKEYAEEGAPGSERATVASQPTLPRLPASIDRRPS